MNQYRVGVIPFFYSALETYSNPKGLPNELEFILYEDSNKLIRQYATEDEEEILERAYKIGSQIVGQMDDFGIGKEYTEDFLNFIYDNIDTIESKDVLEIGCGTGYLLSELQKAGANVLGIEPGIYGEVGSKRYNIPIIGDFFDVSMIEKKYDVILFYGVLEHMKNPYSFLNDVSTIIKDGGKIILSVPNCLPYLESGDISMLIHEHWSYFTEKTLLAAAKECKLDGEVVLGKAAGAIYACLGKENEKTLPEVEMQENEMLMNYTLKIKQNKEKFVKFINSALKTGTLGVYVPSRVINLLKISYVNLPNGIRFFDDSTSLHNKYFPGIEIIVENFSDLEENPVDTILIASQTFGKKIREKLLECGIKSKVFLLEEIFL